MALTKVTGQVVNSTTDLTVGVLTATTVSIAGTLTYEDVTNVDSVGLITARNGINVQSAGLTVVGVTTLSSTKSQFDSAGSLYLNSGGSANSGNYLAKVGSDGSADFLSNISIADKIIHYGDTNTAIRFPAADTITAETAGSERLRIDSSGNVGIVNSSPSNYDSNGRNLVIGSGSGAAGLTVASGATNTGNIYFAAGSTGDDQVRGQIRYNHSTEAMDLYTDASLRMRIDGSGSLLVNTSTSRSVMDQAGNGPTPKLQIEGEDSDGIISVISAGDADANRCGTINLGRHRNGTIGGTPTIVQDGDALGAVVFSGGDGGDMLTCGAKIHAVVNGTPGANDMPGALIFSTTPDGQGHGFNTERMRITSTARFGFNTSNPPRDYCFHSAQADTNIQITNNTTGVDDSAGSLIQQDGNDLYIWNKENSFMSLGTNASEKVRIDSNGEMGVGTSDPDAILHTSTNATDAVGLYLENRADTGSADKIGIVFALRRSGGYAFSGTRIKAIKEGSWTSTPSTIDSALTFHTYLNETASEKARLDSAGNWIVGKGSSPSTSISTAGAMLMENGRFNGATSGGSVLNINRLTNDGNIAQFYQDTNIEGSISISGSTVSYNGAHLARWSQLASGAARIEILRGSVLSNLDEMCEWGEEDNEQLNRMKVSDVEGDPKVAGVFQAWDDDDDTYTNDFYCAMTGDFVIRIAQGTTVANGDLLMSAGDGTAKPQDDDIVRSKTIAKVTSTTVSTTYSDGSYCVPCVLMAC